MYDNILALKYIQDHLRVIMQLLLLSSGEDHNNDNQKTYQIGLFCSVSSENRVMQHVK